MSISQGVEIEQILQTIMRANMQALLLNTCAPDSTSKSDGDGLTPSHANRCHKVKDAQRPRKMTLHTPSGTTPLEPNTFAGNEFDLHGSEKCAYTPPLEQPLCSRLPGDTTRLGPLYVRYI